MAPSVSCAFLFCNLLALISCSNSVLGVERELLKFCASNSKEHCIERIRNDVATFDYLLEGTIWPKLVSPGFEAGSLIDDPMVQLAITTALNGDDSYLNVLYKLKPMKYSYEPSTCGETKLFLNSQGYISNVPLKLSSSSKTLSLFRECASNLMGSGYNLLELVKPFVDPEFNRIFMALRCNGAYAHNVLIGSVDAKTDDELDLIVDEMLLLDPYQAKNFSKIFHLKPSFSLFNSPNINWEDFLVKKEVLRSLWHHSVWYMRGDYLSALHLPFYKKIEMLKLHLFGDSHVWCFTGAERQHDLLKQQMALSKTKTALAPIPLEWGLHNKLSLYFGLFRFSLNLGNQRIPYVLQGLDFQTRYAHYAPLENAYKELFLENPECSETERLVWQKIYDGTFKIGNQFHSLGSEWSLEELNNEDPFMLEIHSKNHVGALVVHSNRLWVCDRDSNPDSVIVEYRAKRAFSDPEALQKFMQQVIDLPRQTIFENIRPLIAQYYTRVGNIPMGAQYALNCPLQAWLLGLRCVFMSMDVPHEKYRLLTGMARELVWTQAITKVEQEPSYQLPLLMAHIMQPEGNYPIEGLFEVTSELFLKARHAFFYPYNHIHTYDIFEATDPDTKEALKSKKISLAKAKTNGDAILKLLIKFGDERGFHPYLKILAMCLLKQGKGVSHYVETLKQHNNTIVLMQEIRQYSQNADFTLIHAVIYSANRFGAEIKSDALECVWELTFGNDWTDFMPDVLSLRRKLPSILLERAPTAKALFYAAILSSFCENPKSAFELAGKFTKSMLKDYQPIRYFLEGFRIKKETPIPLDFPFAAQFPDNNKILLK